jgi:hypothetical protein
MERLATACDAAHPLLEMDNAHRFSFSDLRNQSGPSEAVPQQDIFSEQLYRIIGRLRVTLSQILRLRIPVV